MLKYLISLPKENEWVEFKVDNEDPMMIGERLSALANSACLENEPFGYLVYGVVDETHEVVGTRFKAKMAKKGNEDLEMWLLNRLNPRIDLQVYEFDFEPGKHISLFKIPAAVDRPVKFINVAYVRINSCTRKLMDYPEMSIREIFGNIVVHQCFEEEGFPTVEIFEDRIEFSNPGTPLISVDRFIDEYKSRNDVLTDIMRRMGFCEEKGSGMDKAVMSNESFLLPAIGIRVQENRTVVILFARKTWAETDRQERLMACYQHACIKYVNHQVMTNQSLRERFNIEEQNAAMVSRVIRDAIAEGLVKEEDPDNASRKFKRYIPYWA